MLIFWWFFIFKKAINNLTIQKLKEAFRIEELQDNLSNLPKVEIPKDTQDQLNKIKEEFEKTATYEK